MRHHTKAYLFKKLYLPLGFVSLLMLLSIVVLLNARQKEQQQTRLRYEALLLHASLQDLVLQVDRETQFRHPKAVAPPGAGSTYSRVPDGMLANWQMLNAQWSAPATSPGTVRATDARPDIQSLQMACMQMANELNASVQMAAQTATYALAVLLLAAGGMLAYFLVFMHMQLLTPLQQLQEQLKHLMQDGAGTVSKRYALTLPLQQMLLQYQGQFRQLAQQAERIGDGSFTLTESEAEQNGMLGRAMIGMQQKMQNYFLDEQRRSWSSQGMEQFTELLRDNSQDTESLCKKLISRLVPFVDANQGGIFTLEEDAERHQQLQLQAAYAWGRQKFLNKTIEIGEGLVGQVAQEQELVLITDVPEGYINIGSGLGRAKPRSILLLPLISNQTFMGVIELASFRVFAQHELEFMIKLAENIASTLSNLKTSTQTRNLLDKANTANAHLQAQEEELRQNTEELLATQEAMQRKEAELSGLFTSINFSLITAEMDLEGQLIQANSKLLELASLPEEALLQKRWHQLFLLPDWTLENREAFMQRLMSGEPQNLECQLVGDTPCWLSASFSPVQDAAGRVYKVMLLATNITERKQAELTYISQAEEIMRHEEKLRLYTAELEGLQTSLSGKLEDARTEMQRQIEEIAAEKAKNEAILEGCVDGVVSFGEDGVIEFFNKAAEEIWEGDRQQIIGRKIQEFISLEIVYQAQAPEVFYLKGGIQRCLNIRTEVPIAGLGGAEIEALITLTRVRVNGAYMFTAFVQKVAVELF